MAPTAARRDTSRSRSAAADRLPRFRSIDGDPAALRHHRHGLGQVQLQDAVVVGGGDPGLVDAGDVKGAAEGAVAALAADVGALVVLLILVLTVLGGDGQDAVLHIQLDVALVKAGELGF